MNFEEFGKAIPTPEQYLAELLNDKKKVIRTGVGEYCMSPLHGARFLGFLNANEKSEQYHNRRKK